MLISGSIGAKCLQQDEYVKCLHKPCTAIVKNAIGVIATSTCSRVYIKQNNQWVFDHYSMVSQGATKTSNKAFSNVFAFETEIREIQ